MRIAITSNGKELGDLVEEEFNNCRYFIFYNMETESVEEVVDNPSREIPEGGDKEAGRLIVDKGAEALLTGDIPAEAGDVLAAAGVEVYRALGGTVKDAIERYKSGELGLRSGPVTGLYPDEGSAATASVPEREPGEGVGRGQRREVEEDLPKRCVCPFCGETVADKGIACEKLRCPKCDAVLVKRSKDVT
jgi:predicted Fe-Mo cluster-binding NifX family protein